MDPALWEAIRESRRTGDEIEAIVRFNDATQELPDARIVSRFGRFATVRLNPNAVLQTRSQVRSLKAARPLSAGRDPELSATEITRPTRLSDCRRPRTLPYDGTGIAVGIADWSIDFMHPNFRNPDGSTRLMALWDQRDNDRYTPPEPYGYGALHTRENINHALSSADPYAALDYYPGDSDLFCSGSHGSHVADIAAGNGTVGPAGMAPNADILFVHLADRGTRGLANLGDSVRIVEAVDFMSQAAGDMSLVCNLSVGRHGGPHNGKTLAEMAFDELLQEKPGRFIVQSAGNYASKDIHSCARLQEGETHELGIQVDKADFTPNELEIWTSEGTKLSVEIESPTGLVSKSVALGDSAEIVENNTTAGTIYNRAADPNSNRDNHVNLFLYPAAPPGMWKVRLRADAVSDGIYHAWLERDDGCASCQTRFIKSDVNSQFTTGTLANSKQPLVVGAYNSHSGRREIASFSSSGPTRDGRMKPDVLAPGVRILAARSRGPHCGDDYRSLTRKSGTSMAAPNVAGTVALIMQSSKTPLWSHEIRKLVLGNTDPVNADRGERHRAGCGYLSIPKLMRAIEAAREGNSFREKTETHMTTQNSEQYPIDADAVFSSVDTADGESATADGYNVIAWPGTTPEATPETGDILIRVAEGEPGLGIASVLDSTELWSREQMQEGPIATESWMPGFYASVRDMTGGENIGRRILDTDGRMPSYQMLLRRDSNDDGESSEQSVPTDRRFRAGAEGSARLTFRNIHKAFGSDRREHLYYVTTGAHGNGRDPAIASLRIRNPNSFYDFENTKLRTRLRNIRGPGQDPQMVKMHGAPADSSWSTRHLGEIGSGSAKDVAIRMRTSMLRRAHNSNHPLTSLDVRLLFDEGISPSGRFDFYKNHYLSFFLVDPIEIMWRQKRFIRDISLNDPRRHRRFWQYIHEETFSRHNRRGVKVTMTVSGTTSYTRGGQMSVTVSGSTETGTTLSASVGREQSGSASIGVADFLEIGIGQKTTAELGVSQSFTTTRSFARTMARSESMSRAFTRSITLEHDIPGGRPGYVHTLYAYPKLRLYTVPIVIFDNINRYGQATRRSRVENVPILRLVGWGGIVDRSRRSGYRPPRRRRRRRPQRIPPSRSCPPGDAECEQALDNEQAFDNEETAAAGQSREFVLTSRMPAWQHLISFRPPHHIQRAIHRRNSWPRWNIHKIEDATGNLNLDYYPVNVTRLPVIGGRRVTAEELLEHVRKNINRFVDTDISEFSPYSGGDGRRWRSNSPLGAAIHIDMKVAGGWINVDDGSVVCSQHHPDNWIFSTIWTTGDQAHPVSGNRQFGFMPRDGGGYIFFTRAADRITRSVTKRLAAGSVWDGADRLWRSLQRKLTNFINSNGGVAVWTSRTSRRHNWSTMRRRFHRPSTRWLY